MEEAGRSGVSVRAFCRQRGIPENVFYYWRRVLEPGQDASSAHDEPGQFLLVGLKAEPHEAAGAMLELIVERGWRLRIPRGTDGATLRAVLAALAPAP
jgi:transposase-like protein